MKRRDFIVHIVKLGSLTFLIPGVKLLNAFPQLGNGEALVPGKGFVKLNIVHLNQIPYISLDEFAALLNANKFVNPEKRKIVLYYEGHRFTVTADNNFIVADGKLVQMPYEAKELHEQIYVPVLYFLPIFREFTGMGVDVRIPEETAETPVPVEKVSYKLIKLGMEYRKDGFLVNIELNGPFNEEHLSVNFRNEWLFIDLLGGAFTDDFVRTLPVNPPVREIKRFDQKNLGSLGFRLRQGKWKKEEWLSPAEGVIKILIRDVNYDYEAEREKSAQEENRDHSAKKSWMVDTVIIDPGHGGKDPGAIGYNKIREKDITLAIALKVRNIITRQLPDVQVYLTREKDEFISLKERTQFANRKNGKLFVSIHANSVRDKKVSGFETFILGMEKEDLAREIVMKENSVIEFESEDVQKEFKGLNLIIASLAQTGFMRQSSYFAEILQNEMAKELKSVGLKDRGVKQGPFWVMAGASMPNVLFEAGFLSNKNDALLLKTEKNQLKIAAGIVNAIQRYKQDIESVL